MLSVPLTFRLTCYAEKRKKNTYESHSLGSPYSQVIMKSPLCLYKQNFYAGESLSLYFQVPWEPITNYGATASRSPTY